jgi:hypothetical protein
MGNSLVWWYSIEKTFILRFVKVLKSVDDIGRVVRGSGSRKRLVKLKSLILLSDTP